MSRRWFSLSLVLFLGSISLGVCYHGRKCDPSVASFANPGGDFHSLTLLGKSYTELDSLGLERRDNMEFCTTLLATEKKSVAVSFPNAFLCVKYICQDSLIENVQEGPGDVTTVVNREMLWSLCGGFCSVDVRHGKAVVTGHGKSWELSQGNFLFQRTKSTKNNNWDYLPLLAALCSVPLMRRRGTPLVFFSLVVLSVWLFTRSTKTDTRYALDVEEIGQGATTRVAGFALHNFSRAFERRGSSQCVIYTCNRFKKVRNIRFRTTCDIVNFRVPFVSRESRSVRLNWLKVLTGIWLLKNTKYEKLIYIDRDLILDKDPSFSFRNRNVIFSDLGGLKPDSAMFMFRGSQSVNHTSTLYEWLKKETGETSRRDGGEEQAALFDMQENSIHVSRQPLYTFQCGRNSMNRAECLRRHRSLSIDANVLFSKIAFEVLRLVIFPFFPYRFPKPETLLSNWKYGGISWTAPVLLPVLEIILYQHFVADPGPREVRCPPLSSKAISYGSFDNPYTKTFTSFSASGSVSRTPLGWRCTDLSRGGNDWDFPRLSVVESFAVAQFLAVALRLSLKAMRMPEKSGNARNLKRDKAKS
ncbi:hypothetical protein BWQ96_01257 [Gracilariopsis chorda]|uniref:Nucleotide-diphospho-sugar transferase domain-containing protein n=1 Tax=Gracilariopsis chorda TaxID=448386 RepID=A0A2V3J3E9_9FLOR|nr:hypothetical protein BWQ96_01257 [Gracilariopsis chorda]|eukprot:PXF48915.1 hypothetical protein BWQ96_01257 [Gracilariopsis chorda]